MKDDELKSLTKQIDENLKKHAEVINTLTTNQKVLVSKIEELEKKAEISNRVDEIIKEVKSKTEKKEEVKETTKEEVKEEVKEETKKEVE